MALEAMKLDEIQKTGMLTQQELDHKIQRVTEEVLSAAASPPAGEPMCPRIISAADLVRLMDPFMVYN